jgi:hypothetical protein
MERGCSCRRCRSRATASSSDSRTRCATGRARPGRGNGATNLRQLAASLPDGRLDRREVVAGSFVELPEHVQRFGVQASFHIGALQGIEHEESELRARGRS